MILFLIKVKVKTLFRVNHIFGDDMMQTASGV